MQSIFVVVFWIWTAVSVSVLAYRFATTRSLKGGSSRRDADASAELTEDSELDGAARIAAFEARLATEAAEAGEADEPTAETAFFAPPPAVAPTPTAAPPVESAPVAPDSGAESMPRAASLAEALEGIEMPADLSPLIGDTVNPRRMLFSTDTAAPATVGRSLATELERLGFALNTLDERSIEARRPGAAVEVRILPDLESARTSLGEKIEAIPPDAVVAEFQLR